MTARLVDIAEQAGFSEATVSRVLNGKAGVATSTRKAVLAALDVLGHERPTRLRRRGADLIGLITPELVTPAFSALAQVIAQTLTHQGCTLALGTQTPTGSTEDELTEMLVHRGASGIIFVSGAHSDATADVTGYQSLHNKGIPYVLVNGYTSKLQAPFISADDRVAADLAVTHLASLGHTRIGLATGPRRYVFDLRKSEGFHLATRRILGLTAEESQQLVAQSLPTLEGGQSAATTLIGRGCTAIVCASDMMAIGAIRAARELGLRVPHDISVIGFDDSPLNAFTDPPLTMIRLPTQEMGRAAVQTLLEQLEGTATPSTEFLFTPDLVVRESTAAGRRPADGYVM
ncbi:LacI family DNA-binding transcriptional regulator [Streptomyces griseus]|uniref:LacI family DNA-binding transcriptional regulator n=1 Tax=Streptomyces griseus TaxID=1911 RepID=UPI0037A9FD33